MVFGGSTASGGVHRLTVGELGSMTQTRVVPHRYSYQETHPNRLAPDTPPRPRQPLTRRPAATEQFRPTNILLALNTWRCPTGSGGDAGTLSFDQSIQHRALSKRLAAG